MKQKSYRGQWGRNTETLSMKECIDSYLKALRLERKFDETYIIANWEEIVGPHIARYTQKMHIYNKKLFLQVSSPALRHELMLSKSKLLELINNKTNHELITDIVLK